MRISQFLPVLLLCACAGLPDKPVPAQRDASDYASEHPYYAEYCAMSAIDKKPGFGADIVSGGPGGHALLYLNGLCRDHSSAYPQVRLCDAGDTAQGVGISSNEHFENAAWVAVEGRDLLFGDSRNQGGVTRDSYAATVLDARAQRVYDGITFHEYEYAGLLPGVSREEWKYELSAGTDYGAAMARSRYCATVPMSRNQMDDVAERLNRINAPYRSGAERFEWNVFRANCSHITHSALAAACEWDPWPADQSWLEAAIDMPVPKNEFVDLIRRGNDLDLTDPVAIYRDEAARRDLMQNDRLPTEPGVLAYYNPVIRPNEVYGTDLRLIFYDDPLFGDYQDWFDGVLRQPRYTDAEANRTYFRGLYQRTMAAKLPIETLAARLDPGQAQDFAAFYQRYYAYIERQRSALDALMETTDKDGPAP